MHREAVEPQVFVKDDVRRLKRVVEASRGDRGIDARVAAGWRRGGRRFAVDRRFRIDLQLPGERRQPTSESHSYLRNARSSQRAYLLNWPPWRAAGEADALVGGGRRIAVAGGDAEAALEIVAEVEVGAEPEAEAEPLAVLIDVVLRREEQAGGVEWGAGVDRVEIREGAGVVVPFGVTQVIVADAQVAEQLDARRPAVAAVEGEELFVPHFSEHLLLDFVAHLQRERTPECR